MCFIAACGEHAPAAPEPPRSTYPDASTINASKLSLVADGSSTATITVVLRDAAGTAARSSAGSLSFETTVGTVSEAVDHNDGTYTGTFTSPTLIGSAVISAKLNGVLLANTLTLSLIAGSVDVSHSVILVEANARTLPADGLTAGVISVEPRDVNNNPTAEGVGSVTFATTLGTLESVLNAPIGLHSILLKSSARGT
ncbi:MAG TPA: Ig-like domain-containing protein, partial [Gemmatimonadaceae bacterium]|nr:Ig-like domain-containing protein [Gemmatimonadaceae bacterium]